MGGRKSKPRTTTRYNNQAEMNRLKRDLENQQRANAQRLTEIQNMKTNQERALRELQERAARTEREQKREFERKELEKKRANDKQITDLKVKRLLLIIVS